MKHILAIVLVLFAMSAQAMNLEIGAGQTRYSKPPNSQYYQQEFPHDFDLIGAAYYIGVTDVKSHHPAWFNAYSNGMRYRFGWLDLGNASSEAYATSDDANYSGTGGGCYDMSKCRFEDLSKWETHGRTKGFELSASPEWAVGSGHVFAKFGLYFHRPRINVRIWRDDADPARKVYDYKEKVNVGPTVGIGYSRGNFSLSVSAYKINASGSGEDDPTNDIDPVNIPQNTGAGLFDTIQFQLTYRH
jgi:hypothetical protein